MFPLCASLKTSCSLKNLSSSGSNSDDDDDNMARLNRKQTMYSVNHIDKLVNTSKLLTRIQCTKLKKTSSKSLFVKFIRKKILNGLSKYCLLLFSFFFVENNRK